MRKLAPVVLAVLCVVGLSASLWAGPRRDPRIPPSANQPSAGPSAGTDRSRASSPPSEEQRQRYWDEAKSLLKQGAYREALQIFDVILATAPDDPWAKLFQSICEKRLNAPPSFTQLSPEQASSLKRRLEDEERDQRRTAVQQKVLERQLSKEQARWDAELKVLEQQAAREEARRARAAKAEEAGHRRTEQLAKAAAPTPAPVQPSPAAPAVAVEEQPPSAPPPHEVAPSASLPAPPTGGAQAGPAPTAKPRGRSVELAPVVVPTVPGAPSEEHVSPSLVGRPAPPPGAVQINAREMHVSPDRKIAVADGDVEVVHGNTILTCDHLTLFTDTKDVYAEGRVRMEEGNQVFRGEMVHYNFNTKKGRFLQGTVSVPPWHEHGRSVEELAEGVFQVTPGYLTSCDLEPPHFKFYGRRSLVFGNDRLARMSNVALLVEKVPLFYLPLMVVAERQTPFFLRPGKKKPWEQFVLGGYRYYWPEGHDGTIHLDWRRAFGTGGGLDHKFATKNQSGLVKAYYNEEPNIREPKSNLPKGAKQNRYRLLVRHQWNPMQDTLVTTDFQKFSDINYRKDFLFRDEVIVGDIPESTISMVTNTDAYSMTALLQKRVNRFQSQTEEFPDFKFDVRDQQIGDTRVFSQTSFGFTNLQSKTAHSDEDTDVVRANWFEQLSYALNLFKPIEVTPSFKLRETYYNKDKQGGAERTNGDRNVISGQWGTGTSASLKLFRIFPLTTNALGLDINWLRHVVTPTISYDYIHRPTVAPGNLTAALSETSTNSISFGLENKLQTKRHVQELAVPGKKPQMTSYDLARLLISLPYTFRGINNKNGGVVGDWAFDFELTPWPWLSLGTDWTYPSHFVPGSRDSRVTKWNVDLSIINPKTRQSAQQLRRRIIEDTTSEYFQMKPVGHWEMTLEHRYSYNDKTEDTLEFQYQLGPKWHISTFHRFTLKEVKGGEKRFNNLREVEYVLHRDLHDWMAEFSYRVDREFGEEIFFNLILKAFPTYPVELSESYHEPKFGSQSSPFSPVPR